MNLHRCCTGRNRREHRPPHLTSIQRIRQVAQWFFPGALLVLMPKCPMCLAGYVALCTGVGMSFPAAANLRIVLLSLSAAALAGLMAKRLAASAGFSRSPAN